jgi:hypothetical protein
VSRRRLILVIAFFAAEFWIMPSEVGFHHERADTSAVVVIKEICVAAIRAAQSHGTLDSPLKARCAPFADGEQSP